VLQKILYVIWLTENNKKKYLGKLSYRV